MLWMSPHLFLISWSCDLFLLTAQPPTLPRSNLIFPLFRLSLLSTFPLSFLSIRVFVREQAGSLCRVIGHLAACTAASDKTVRICSHNHLHLMVLVVLRANSQWTLELGDVLAVCLSAILNTNQGFL